MNALIAEIFFSLQRQGYADFADAICEIAD